MKVLRNGTVAVIGILAITGLLLYALSKGMDGLLLITGLAIISGLTGYNAEHLITQIKTFRKR